MSVPAIRRLGRSARWVGLALLLSCPSPAIAARPPDPAEGSHRWRLQISSGLDAMLLGEAKSFYRDVLDVYRAGGVPLESQREFPANIAFGGDVLYEVRPQMFLGFGSRYTWSHAYSLYEDTGGTLDVVSRVGLLSVVGVIQRSWRTSARGSSFVELRVGTGFVSFEESERVALRGIITGESESSLQGRGHAPLAELGLGTRRSFGRDAVFVAAGYRHCNVPGPPFELDVSGFVLTLGVSH